MMKGNKNRYSHLLRVEADVASQTLITYIKKYFLCYGNYGRKLHYMNLLPRPFFCQHYHTHNSSNCVTVLKSYC